MKTALRKLVVTAAIAAAVPTATFACDEDRAAPVPAPAGWSDGRAGRPDRDGRWDGRDGRWDERDGRDGRWQHERRDGWREQERARLRAEYARLDQAREDFYSAPWRRNPRRADRFERWYAFQRVELDRRWSALSFYAAR